MASRVVLPESKTLHISEGDWLLVKKRLNHGEQRRAFSRRYVTGLDGEVRLNPLQSGMAQITAYLIDWSLTGPDGKIIPVRGRSVEDVEAAIDSLDPVSAYEILAAIQVHEEAMARERADEKKTLSGATELSAISTSPVLADGGTSGSVT